MAVQIAGHEGIAFNLIGPQTEPDEDTEWSGIENPTGMLLAVMVGDDRVWVVDPDDVTFLDDEDYCGGCGQIGCAWG